jgi:hypothetical protein
MSNTVPFGVASAREIERQKATCPDRIVSAPLFGPCAKLAWPFKTAAKIAVIANTNERTAARWLSGEIEPPPCVAAALFSEIFPPRGK